jgi:CHAT domain-containing protein
MLSLDGAIRYLPIAALHDGQGYVMEKYRTVLFNDAASDKHQRCQ